MQVLRETEGEIKRRQYLINSCISSINLKIKFKSIFIKNQFYVAKCSQFSSNENSL